ncbi:MAG: putative porin [Gammaproteobacteria bacterium]
MRSSQRRVRSGLALALGAVLTGFAWSAAQAGMVDEKLLGMLLTNGSITQAQHDELMRDLKRAERRQVREDRRKLDKREFIAYQQTAGWAASTALRGDVRVRNDYVNVEDETKGAGRDKDRQRIRARLGAFTQVNPEVETGIQLSTASGADRRSTNQDLDGYADRKPVWLDLAYIDYHPIKVPGLRIFAGKMKQPWMSVGDVAWDADINPEGFAANYTRKNGTTTLFGTAGYFPMKDNVDGDGVERNNDLALYALQAGIAFDASAKTRLTLGVSSYQFSNDGQPTRVGAPSLGLAANGNTTDRFGVYELFGQLDVIGLPLPLSTYGQIVRNADARDYRAFEDADEDTGWLLGARTNIRGLALDYSYRVVDRNAVPGIFVDSDFAAGYMSSNGHKLRAQYDLLENVNVSLSWFLAESDAASRNNADDASVETLMLDLNARF